MSSTVSTLLELKNVALTFMQTGKKKLSYFGLIDKIYHLITLN